MTQLTFSGFKKQLELMFKPIRVVATVILFVSIVLCFVAAFVLPAILCIVFVIVCHQRSDGSADDRYNISRSLGTASVTFPMLEQ